MGYQSDHSDIRYGHTTGTASAYLLSVAPPLLAYQAGDTLQVKFHIANAAGPMINIDGIGPVPLLKESGGALVPLDAGDLNTVRIYHLVYEGTGFQVEIASAGAGQVAATETVAGIARIATQAEVSDGLADDLVVSPKKLAVAQQAKEDLLGNPVTDGAILQSSASGQRSWKEVDRLLYTDVITTFIGPFTFEATMGEIYTLPAGTIKDGQVIQVHVNGILQAAPDKTLRVRMGNEILFEHTLSGTGIFSIDIIAGRQNANAMTGKAIFLLDGDVPVVKKVQPTTLDLDNSDHIMQFTGQNSVSTPYSISSHCFIIHLLA